MKNNKLQEEISLAQKIITNYCNFSKDRTFHELSRVYRTTNEKISAENYLSLLKNKNKILSIIGSGDQIINSIFFGTNEITGYDISIFPKYYLMLKIAAIKTLSKEEYLDFFAGNLDRDLFNHEIYEKIRESLDKDYIQFWDSIFNYFDEYEINESCLFSTEISNKNLFINNNPYLQGENYNETKNKLDNINISLLRGNIFKLTKKDIGTFNLINLSNIINYLSENFNCKGKDALIRYREFIKELPLKDNGIAITYIFGLKASVSSEKALNESFNEDNFSIVALDGETYNDGLLTYQKKK